MPPHPASAFTRALEEGAARYIGAKRWFAGKGRKICSVRLLTADPVRVGDLPEWICAIFSVSFADGAAQTYFLPLSVLHAEDGPATELPPEACIAETTGARGRCRIFDALNDDRFCRGVLSAIRKSASVSLRNGILRFSATSALNEMDAGHDELVRRPKLEQSHSSFRIGDHMIMKIYRQIQHGMNPELEIGRYLTEKAVFPNMARVGGAIEYLEEGGRTTTLAVLQEFIPNEGDCWNEALAHLKRRSEAVYRGETPADDGFPERMGALGERVGMLHAALAGTSGDPAFDPEPVSGGDWAGWMEAFDRSLADTLEGLDGRRPFIPDRYRAAVDGIFAASGRVRGVLKTFRPDLASIRKARLHGDLHLGQVLMTKDDFVIIDFEGEPARSLAERRRKHLPMRDVAGMLRSFGYAAQMTVQRESHGDAASDLLQTGMAEAWERRVSAEFLRGYRRGAQGCPAVPGDSALFEALLNLFLLEKAVYECSYEMNNRPDWIGVPITGLAKIVINI